MIIERLRRKLFPLPNEVPTLPPVPALRALADDLAHLGGATGLPRPVSVGWNTALLDRVVLAGALGDAWGYTVEFDTTEAMDERYGVDGLRTPQPSVGPLVVSDDTQMLLFTLDGVHRARPDQGGKEAFPRMGTTLLTSYQAWYDTQKGQTAEPGAWYDLPLMRQCRAPGHTCLGALGAHRRGPVPSPINDSKGCGGVMRTGVIGAWQGMGADDAWALGDLAASLTHGHPDGRWPSAWIAAWIARADDADQQDPAIAGDLDGTKTPERLQAFLHAWDADAERLNQLAPGSGTAQRMAAARTLSPTGPWEQAWLILGQGWVGDEALAIAAYAVRRAQTFEEAVFRAVHHDGDSDSTGALAAQLWAAWFGVPVTALPWLQRLDVLPAWRRLRATLPLR